MTSTRVRRCILLAVHHGRPPGLSAADNEAGWNMALDNLARRVETAPPAS
jgi:hypothetical protein